MQPLRGIVADQLAPLVALRDRLTAGWRLPLDGGPARERYAAGERAFAAAPLLAGTDGMAEAFLRVDDAFEEVGLASSRDAALARSEAPRTAAHAMAWLAGEPLPRDGHRRLARRVAAVVGNSILARAALEVCGGAPPSPAARGDCPCCGGPAEFERVAGGSRLLLCARCDTSWPSTIVGCLGCGATASPAVARIPAAQVGWTLVVCQPCGRYLKQGAGEQSDHPLVERILTASLDEAAEERGLRL
jgi:hypothetical protein